MVTDKELVENILKQGARDFNTLVIKYERLVFSIVSKVVFDPKEDIEDLCQEVFITVFNKLKSFKFQSKLSTWIASIAYNKAINHLRNNKLKHQNTIGIEEELSGVDNETPENILSAKNEAEFIRLHVDSLPHTYRTALTLFHLEEMHIDEIATIMKINSGSVRVLLFRARKQLKEKLSIYKQKKNSNEKV